MADADLHALPALLGADDPAIYTLHRPHGASPYLLLADHAGQQVPRVLAGLGLPQAELDRHIGWDIGIAGTTAHCPNGWMPGPSNRPIRGC